MDFRRDCGYRFVDVLSPKTVMAAEAVWAPTSSPSRRAAPRSAVVAVHTAGGRRTGTIIGDRPFASTAKTRKKNVSFHHRHQVEKLPYCLFQE